MELAGLVCEFILEFGEASLVLVITLIIGALLERFNKPGPTVCDCPGTLADEEGGSTSIPFPAIGYTYLYNANRQLKESYHNACTQTDVNKSVSPNPDYTI